MRRNSWVFSSLFPCVPLSPFGAPQLNPVCVLRGSDSNRAELISKRKSHRPWSALSAFGDRRGRGCRATRYKPACIFAFPPSATGVRPGRTDTTRFRTPCRRNTCGLSAFPYVPSSATTKIPGSEQHWD